MKFRFSWLYFFLWLIVVLLFNYKTFYTSTPSATTSTTTQEIVEIGDVTSTIEVVGEANLVDEQSLRFNKLWTVKKIYVKEGQEVKKGQVIAELDSKDAENSIRQAELNLENSQINLKQLYEPVDESKILQAKNSITSSQNAFDVAQKEYDNLIQTHKNALDNLQKGIEISQKEYAVAQTNYDIAKLELENLKKEQGTSLSNTLATKSTTVINIEDSFRSNLAYMEEVTQEADYIMGVTEDNKDKNDDYESFLWAKDQESKDRAKIALWGSIETYTSLKPVVYEYDYSGEKAKILPLLQKFLSAYNELYTTIDSVYKTIESSVPSEGTLWQSEIDSMKSKMSGYRTTILSKINTINANINTLNTLSDTDLISESNNITLRQKQSSLDASTVSLDKKQSDLDTAQKDYDTTMQSYAIVEESKLKDIDIKRLSLDTAKLSLDELIEWPTSENVQKAQNSVKQAEIQLISSNDSLEDYELIAPFDGVVRKVDYKVGDKITSDAEKYVYIENPNLLQIKVMLDQIDITKVKMWQEAITVFDAYPTLKVQSKIVAIDTTPVQSSGVVSYEVDLIIDDETFDKTVLSGMTANIEIQTASRKSVLTLKASAITEKDGKKYVTIDENGQEKQVEIITWLTSGGVTEIVSGLSKGDVVLVKTFKVSTTTTSSGLFSPPTNRNRTSTSSSGWQSGPPPF